MKAPDKLKDAQKDWTNRSLTQKILDQISSLSDLDEKVNWLEKTLLLVLDAHTKILRVTSFSKR